MKLTPILLRATAETGYSQGLVMAARSVVMGMNLDRLAFLKRGRTAWNRIILPRVLTVKCSRTTSGSTFSRSSQLYAIPALAMTTSRWSVHLGSDMFSVVDDFKSKLDNVNIGMLSYDFSETSKFRWIADCREYDVCWVDPRVE